MAKSVAQPSLFSDINVTPFIDVLLVLLIMLIMTLPTATHKLPLDLPVPNDTKPADPHTLAIDARGALGWDGRSISDAELGPLLAATARADGPLVIDPEAQARYERVEEVLARVRRAGVDKLGFVGRYRLPD